MMKFTINKNNFLDVLSKIQGITGRKSNLVITENILIKSTDSGISIIATDLETSFEGYYSATIEKEGVIVINAKKFFEIIKNFPSDEISINEVENRWLEIKNHNVEYHIVCMDPDDFPETDQFEDIVFCEIESSALKKMIDKVVMIAAASDEKRTYIKGVNFERIDKGEGEGKIVRMVSTDAKRLSKVDYFYDKKIEIPTGESVMIPKKGLSEVGKFLDDEDKVQIGIKDNHFIVKKDNETISISLLEGDFPEYNDIISHDHENEIELDKKLFLMMLKRMSILSSDNYKSVIFNFEDNQLVINTTNPDIGESREEMSVEFEKERIEVAFNPKYFIETLNVINNDKIILNIKDHENPCVIKGKDDKTFLSIIMPMKI